MVIYFVKPGDTLWKIAKNFKSTINDIVSVNGLEDANKIYPGQQLYIPKFVNKKIAVQKMDSIYSRKRIKIPRIKGFYTKNKNAKKIFSIFIVVIVATFTFYSLFQSINPIFEGLCVEKAREIGTYIMNNASNKILNNIEYNNIVQIEENGGNRILKTDVVVINKIASDIALEAE